MDTLDEECVMEMANHYKKDVHDVTRNVLEVSHMGIQQDMQAHIYNVSKPYRTYSCLLLRTEARLHVYMNIITFGGVSPMSTPHLHNNYVIIARMLNE